MIATLKYNCAYVYVINKTGLASEGKINKLEKTALKEEQKPLGLMDIKMLDELLQRKE